MSLTRRLLFVLTALVYLLPGRAGAQAYTTIVVFGDSLSDIGNDAALSRAKYTVNGQVPGPATGYTDGRFTDGTDTVPAAHNYNGVWIEQLAAALPAHPVLKNSLAGGTDYAYGFGTTDVGTSVFSYGPANVFSFLVNNLGQQVTDYLATSPVITNKTLFVVWGGANDLINATTPADIAAAAAREAAIVQRLINAGATDIIVPNLPPLGLVPRFNGSLTTSVPATQAATGFDQALAGYLGAIPLQNPGKTLHIFQLDIYTLFSTIVGPPLSKGFVNVTAKSQGNSAINPDTYLFWDDLHPTTYGHNQVAAAALTLIGTPVTTTTTLTSSNSNANLNSSITLTASVSSATGTPMGTVTFLDGTTTLGSALVSGSATTTTATYTTSALTAGTHQITAQFTGVNGYASSTSAAVIEVVTAPALSSSLSPSTVTIKSGSTGTTTLTITSVGGYSGTATYACGTLPAHMSCSFSPASLTFTGTNTPQSTILTIGINAVAGLLMPPRPGPSSRTEIVTAFLLPGLGLAGLAAFRRKRPGSPGLGLLLAMGVVSAGAMLGLSGCFSSDNGTAKGTYTVVINITANGATTPQTLTVVVQ